jgi:hypothetical protein
MIGVMIATVLLIVFLAELFQKYLDPNKQRILKIVTQKCLILIMDAAPKKPPFRERLLTKILRRTIHPGRRLGYPNI